ncbi:MAG: replication initiation factor domain-containing protein [Betaproteobacteria bacterium]|nr:replication initiation factor domain-containing protein [Betaproteobacteria bacterium]
MVAMRHPGLDSESYKQLIASAQVDFSQLKQEAAGAVRGTSGATAADSAPLVTRGEENQDHEGFVKLIHTHSGKPLIIQKRFGYGGKNGFIDWVHFTVHESTAKTFNNQIVVNDQELILSFSFICQKIFGFGIAKQNSSGRHFYKKSFVIGDNFGLLCHGGQKNTVLVQITGTGLAAAVSGWEKRLYDFLTTAQQPRLTRVDVAHDDFEGVYSVDKALKDFKKGKYTFVGKTVPDCEQRGNWLKPNGKGRTFNVGQRVSGKFGRIYEKGKQLGDKTSPWCRVEVEIKSVDRVIPFDILLNAGAYLAATYPALTWIEKEQCRIKTQTKTTEITYDAMCEWLVRQCGSALAVVAEVEGGAEKLVEKIAIFKKMPARLVVPSFHNSPVSIHKRILEKLHPDVVLDRAFT